MTQNHTENEDSVPEKEEVNPISEFSRSLRFLREKAGYSIERASISTRISLEFINSLESGQFDNLPGKVFGRGFIKNLCKIYDSDASEILRCFDIACFHFDKDNSPSLAPAISRQNYKKTSNVVKIHKSQKKLSFFRKIHWFSFGKAVLYYLLLPIIATVTIWICIKTINLDGIFTYIKSSSMSEEGLKNMVSSSDDKLPLELKIYKNKIKPKYKNPVIYNETALINKEKIMLKLVGETDFTSLMQPPSPILTIKVKDEVKIRIKQGNKKTFTKMYLPNIYSFEVKDFVETLIFDASKVDITFSGKSLGKIGNKGRIRKITFNNNLKNSPPKKN